MTANQYLARLGLGPVNPVCSSCKREVGRVWTARKMCERCLLEQATPTPQQAAKRRRLPRHGRI